MIILYCGVSLIYSPTCVVVEYKKTMFIQMDASEKCGIPLPLCKYASIYGSGNHLYLHFDSRSRRLVKYFTTHFITTRTNLIAYLMCRFISHVECFKWYVLYIYIYCVYLWLLVIWWVFIILNVLVQLSYGVYPKMVLYMCGFITICIEAYINKIDKTSTETISSRTEKLCF